MRCMMHENKIHDFMSDDKATYYKFRNAKNGFVIEIIYNQEDDPTILVCQEDENNEFDAFIQLLYAIADDFGPSAGKYSPKRIHVFNLPGNDFDGAIDQKYYNELKDLHEQLTDILKNVSVTKS